MKVAIFGCLHGMLDAMYDAVQDHENISRDVIDFIIVCGDCQTIRHADDLICLSVPNKYKKIGDFHKYYSGVKKIPKLTIFVGGNHEASNYLMSLPYGGWVCDNFYYLGYAGVIRYKGLRIAGVSGIYNSWNCKRGRYEKLPFDRDSLKSIYHTRQLDIFRLQLLSRSTEERDPIDVFLSHDWPRGIYDFGNRNQLIRFKPFFKQDIESKQGLGSPLTEPLIRQLKPKKWFAAHLHCKFQARVKHDQSTDRCTDFLSLNKIENRRNFMDVLVFEPTREHDESDENLYYDEEWLTILRKTVKLESSSRDNAFCPRIEDDIGKSYFPTKEDIQTTIEMMNKTGVGLKILKNFTMTEPVIYNRPHGIQTSLDKDRKKFYPNPQTLELCSRLQLNLSDATQSCSSSVKKEPGIIDIETEIKLEPIIKDEPIIKQESIIKHQPIVKHEPIIKHENKPESDMFDNHPVKKLALSRDCESDLDDDGCLPFYIDTKGNK